MTKMGRIRLEWDARKEESNRRKHRISFELASPIFDDPLVYEYEEGKEHAEVRCRAIGQVAGTLLFVSYVSFEEDGEEVVRIISARRATRQERRAYERHSQAYR